MNSLVLLKTNLDKIVTIKIKTPTTDLYNQDFLLWVDETMKHLQDQDIAHLDWEHLIEEIEAVGSEQRRKVQGYLKQLLIHLLLYRYWLAEKERYERGWRDEIENFRDELADLLESKTLYQHCQTEMNTDLLTSR